MAMVMARAKKVPVMAEYFDHRLEGVQIFEIEPLAIHNKHSCQSADLTP